MQIDGTVLSICTGLDSTLFSNIITSLTSIYLMLSKIRCSINGYLMSEIPLQPFSLLKYLKSDIATFILSRCVFHSD